MCFNQLPCRASPLPLTLQPPAAIFTGTPMPLPNAPTRKPQNSAGARGGDELLFKGVLCMLIGLAVLLSPRFITSPGMQGIVANAGWVGWFALVLGATLTGVYLRRRLVG